MGLQSGRQRVTTYPKQLAASNGLWSRYDTVTADFGTIGKGVMCRVLCRGWSLMGWDGTAARLRASQQLGWTASLQVEPADILGRRRLVRHIIDKDGVAVVGANVQLLMFHHARAADRVEVSLNPEKDGTYSALVPMKRAGLWECRIAARRGDALFKSVILQDVANQL